VWVSLVWAGPRRRWCGVDPECGENVGVRILERRCADEAIEARGLTVGVMTSVWGM
jgi:hypothetical protein